MDGTNVILRWALNGKDGLVPLDCLSDADRAYLVGSKSVSAASQQVKSNDVASSLKTNAGNQVSVPAASQQAKSNDVASYLKTNAGNQMSVLAASQQAKSNNVGSDSGLPLLPPMTQQEIVSWLSWTVEAMKASSK